MPLESLPTVLFNPTPPEAIEQPELGAVVQLPMPAEPTEEEARAVEVVFAQQDENRFVAGMIGLWTSALVMHDLAVETFRSSEEDEEETPDPKKKKDKPKEPPS